MAEFKFEGIEELLKKIDEIENVVGKVENTLKESAEPIKKAYIDNVNRSKINHEHLQDNIVISDVKGIGNKKYVEVGVDSDSKVYWDKFLEFGTSKMTAQRPLSRALEDNKDKVQEIIAKKLKEELGL